MNFQPATKYDLKAVIGWIPDAKSCAVWAGPKVMFPIKLEQLCNAIEFDTIHNSSLVDKNVLLALGQIRIFENKRGHLSRIIVNPEYRGKGIGEIFCSGLINKAKQLKCKTISLNVDKDNQAAIGLYKKLGFIVPSIQQDRLRKNIIYMELKPNK
ncbi:MAG: GNAT family N-acetyltransferase [Ignavibacteria bacterium]|nr:GNAT family N-acetyltransferase [Ignavibacteria bacterium]MBT8381123.1 GNAT family N-acetyltransferase [Ignavibacteria bacterium]MBT8392159.1 GNAT family N-acetyltransferase [Ignavibacteria bacterium]NNJ53559.1 GNAT family N-acetyltransferase [Ignavibacteriaceae bacterium]NNL21431.1 GNAT family N-acetyltransferase [Ignavibacteriaceae bacterium]